LKVLHGHKDGVNSLSVHPSGKIALSVSRDRTLRMWNLINARAAYDTTLNFEAETVVWSPNGSTYALSSFHQIRIYDESGTRLLTIENPPLQPFLALVYIAEDLLACGGEDRQVTVYHIPSGEKKVVLQGFSNRVKGLAAVPKITQNDRNIASTSYLISASSDSFIKVWDIDKDTENPILSTSIEGRITCVTAAIIPTLVSHTDPSPALQLSNPASDAVTSAPPTSDLNTSTKPNTQANKKREQESPPTQLPVKNTLKGKRKAESQVNHPKRRKQK